MHPDAAEITDDLARSLVDAQLPRWADLPLRRLPPLGTDHQLFRLGEELLLRLPIIGWAADQAGRDARWLPVLAPHLPVAVPVPVAVGDPDVDYPYRWSVVPWIEGENAPDDGLRDVTVARELAAFVEALHGIDPSGGPVKEGLDRGVPLAARDEVTRDALARCGDRVDAAVVTAAWEDALAVPAYDTEPVWIHGDLHEGNLLLRDGHLAGVIDWGALGLGDPAPDYATAWLLLRGPARAAFRDATGVDDATWQRARGWALSVSLMEIPYYWDRSPAIAAKALSCVGEVLTSDA